MSGLSLADVTRHIVDGLSAVYESEAYTKYSGAMYSALTIGRYAEVGRQFAYFCDQNGCGRMPASRETLIAYFGHIARTLSYSSIKLHRCAIRAWHVMSGFPDFTHDPEIEAILAGVRRLKRPVPQLPIAPMELRAMLAVFDTRVPLDVRDATFCILYYAGALTQRIAASLDRSHVEFADGGVYLETSDPRRPTIFLGEGECELTCPVRWLAKWLAIVGNDAGPLFPTSRPRRGWKSTPLSWLMMKMVVKRTCRQAGIPEPRHSPISFRKGFIIAAGKCVQPIPLAKFVGLQSVNALERHTGYALELRPIRKTRGRRRR